MRLTIVVSSLEAGGTERFATVLAGELARLGHDITLITLTRRERDFYALHQSIHRIALHFDRDPRAGRFVSTRSVVSNLRRLRASVRIARPQVVIALGWSTNVITLAATRLTRTPVMVCERTDPVTHKVAVHWRFGRRLLYPFASRLVVQTESAAEGVRGWLPSRRVRILPNPVLPAAHARQSSPGPIPTVVSMGRMTAEKGLDVLLEAFATVVQKIPDARLKIIGDGPLFESLVEQSVQLGVVETVEFTGLLSDPHSAMTNAWCYVLTSRLEGFPNSLLEAMAMGIPAVATDCRSGPRDLIGDNVGLLVPVDDVAAVADAIIRVLQDRALARTMAASSRARADDYGIDRIVQRWTAELGAIARS